jgi:hypothetical protein
LIHVHQKEIKNMDDLQSSPCKLTTPVVLIIFKRPEQTARVFRAIRLARPQRLYVIADGPRNGEEAILCQAAREIVNCVDWDCEVIKYYSDRNLGCTNRIVSGLDLVFQQEEGAIILEDDCLPHQTFFQFCDELLKFYKNDTRVMHISGCNYLQGRLAFNESYYFSKYPHVGGWATWRRAWLLFHKWDKEFSRLNLDFLIYRTKSEREFWSDLLEQLRSDRTELSWDYQWALICMSDKALCVVPKSNMITNIGFGPGATHTQEDSWLANLPAVPVDFPLTYTVNDSWNLRADQITGTIFFHAAFVSIIARGKSFVRRVIIHIEKELK